MSNIFDQQFSNAMIDRVNKLTPETKGEWGKMNVTQMLAHLNVAYEVVYTDKHPKANALARIMMKMFVKGVVVGPKPYKRNNPTAKIFIIGDDRDYEVEKKRLIDHIEKTQELGADHFDGKENLNFGPLSVNEWHTLFYKHFDHHMTQFGV